MRENRDNGSAMAWEDIKKSTNQSRQSGGRERAKKLSISPFSDLLCSWIPLISSSDGAIASMMKLSKASIASRLMLSTAEIRILKEKRERVRMRWVELLSCHIDLVALAYFVKSSSDSAKCEFLLLDLLFGFTSPPITSASTMSCIDWMERSSMLAWVQITLKVSDKSENCCRQSLILSRRDVFIMEKAPELTNLNGTKARNESRKI